MGYVRDSDVKAVTMLPDLNNNNNEPLEENWDVI